MGRLDQLDGPKNVNQVHAWRHGLLLNGVDMFGFGGFVTAAHSDADVDGTVVAVGHTIEWLREEGMA